MFILPTQCLRANTILLIVHIELPLRPLVYCPGSLSKRTRSVLRVLRVIIDALSLVTGDINDFKSRITPAWPLSAAALTALSMPVSEMFACPSAFSNIFTASVFPCIAAEVSSLSWRNEGTENRKKANELTNYKEYTAVAVAR